MREHARACFCGVSTAATALSRPSNTDTVLGGHGSMPQGRARYGLGWQLAMPPSITTTTASFDSINVLLANALFIVPSLSHRGRARRASEDAPPSPSIWMVAQEEDVGEREVSRTSDYSRRVALQTGSHERTRPGRPILACPRFGPPKSNTISFSTPRRNSSPPQGGVAWPLVFLLHAHILCPSPRPPISCLPSHRPTSTSTSTSTSPSTSTTPSPLLLT
jgi:hypothetical protein